jgi:hypothetical protein
VNSDFYLTSLGQDLTEERNLMNENDVKRIVCDSMAVPFEAVDSNPAVEVVNE